MIDTSTRKPADQTENPIFELVSEKWDLAATRRFFTRALGQAPRPAEVTTDRAQACPQVLDELLPAACHVLEKYANNPIESDHSRLKADCGRCVASTALLCTGDQRRARVRAEHPPRLLQLGVENPTTLRVAAAFCELALAI